MKSKKKEKAKNMKIKNGKLINNNNIKMPTLNIDGNKKD